MCISDRWASAMIKEQNTTKSAGAYNDWALLLEDDLFSRWTGLLTGKVMLALAAGQSHK